jgi:hypothetical protein
MNMTKRALTTRAITVNDYYSERFLRIETELKHQHELMKLGFERMDKRFEAMDKRFEDMRAEMNARFENMSIRMDKFMKWSFGMTLTCSGLVIAAMKLWK